MQCLPCRLLGESVVVAGGFQFTVSWGECTTLDIHINFMALSQPALTLKSRPDFSAG